MDVSSAILRKSAAGLHGRLPNFAAAATFDAKRLETIIFDAHIFFMTGAEKFSSHIAIRLGDLVKSLHQDWIIANEGALPNDDNRQNQHLNEIRTVMGQALAERHMLEKERIFLEEDVIKLDQQAEEAIRNDREDFARSLVRKKLQLARQQEQVSETLSLIEQMIDRFEALLRDFHDISNRREHAAQLQEIDNLIRQNGALSHDANMPEG